MLKDIAPLYTGTTLSNGILQTKIVVPTQVKVLYVIPQIVGLGDMQMINVSDASGSVEFGLKKPDYFSGTKAVRESEDEYPCIPIHPETGKNIYTFYSGATGTYDGQPAYTDDEINVTDRPQANASLSEEGSPLVGYMGLVTYEFNQEIAEMAHEMFPEENLTIPTSLSNLMTSAYNTDIVVNQTNGAEIWVTYLDDGRFHEGTGNENMSYNTLCYFHYPVGTTPSYDDIRKNMLFPNTHPDYTAPGTKVQLLYWDGSKYVKTFPNGTAIGWCMVQNGYGTAQDNPENPNRFGLYRLNRWKFYRFSYADMNITPSSDAGLTLTSCNQSIGRYSLKHNTTIVGVENKFMSSDYCDGDFNDILVAVSSSAVIKPNVDIEESIDMPGGNYDDDTQEESEGVISEIHGTLAFEDLYPEFGDYDHNDFVTDYTYGIEKNSNGQIIALHLNFKPRAVGAGHTLGFGIEIPQITNSDISSVSGARLETDTDNPTIIVWDNVREGFNNATGWINTDKSIGQIQGTAKKVKIVLSTPLSTEVSNNFNVNPYNPFICVNGRENETHLPNYSPTNKNNSKFGTGKDLSDGISTFYISNNGFAWAIDITKENSQSPSWRYPIETKAVNVVYPNYEDWAKGGNTNTDWFEASKAVQELLY